MFKHILLPTDGSVLSRRAVAGGLALAKECGILEAAAQAGCDLIYMASHGWKGAAHLLGSQTMKVLHYSQVPVLVHKAGRHDGKQEAP